MSDKDDDEPKLEPNKSPVSVRRAKKLRYLSEYLSKQESRKNCKKVSKILKKSEHERTEDEKATLADHEDIVKRISKNKEKRQLNHLRTLETEDSEELLQSKCVELASLIKRSKKTVIYTGAGISTAASIPDYRGPQGVWTLLQKGEQLAPQDLSDAEPTLTHMCIRQLHEHGHVKHVVSQNCDGLHIRSGLPRQILSEVHGDMFIEVCHSCRPNREYIRLFDVTENTGVRKHFTGRYCQKCGGKLKDTIVHFGEKGGMKSPYRWKEAVKAANKCDLILCLGSSLKILKKYACLWCMDRVKNKRPNLVIVNLQWTPKDESATLKINGKCDIVLETVMKILGYSVPKYSLLEDPIFRLATPLEVDEIESTSKKVLQTPNGVQSLKSHGLSRTPTPSDSSDSQMSSSSSSDSCDVQLDLKNFQTMLPNCSSQSSTSFPKSNVCSGYDSATMKMEDKYLSKSDKICNEAKKAMQGKVVTSKLNPEEICQTRSERICNEAKIAMHERLVNAQLHEMYGMGAISVEKSTKKINGIVHHGSVNDDGTEGQMPKPQYDPLRGGPFDPGPSAYKDKLVYLQMLQGQLEELKRKQKMLKKQEELPIVQQQNRKTGSSENLILTGNPPKKQGLHITSPVIRNHGNLQSLLTTDTIRKVEANLNSNYTSDDNLVPCLKSPTSTLASPKDQSNPKRSPVKMENQSSPFLKFEPDTGPLKSKTDLLDSKLRQNLHEQKDVKSQLVSMATSQHQLEDQLNQQHKLELLQLHQQFLVQQQVRHQTPKQEEMVKLFVFQQHSLTAQQNAKLLLLRQKYLGEVQRIESHLEKLKKCQTILEKQIQNCKIESRSKVSLLISPNRLLSPPNSSCHTIRTIASLISPNRLLNSSARGGKIVSTSTFQSDLKMNPKSPSVKVSPSKKDHSIAALLGGVLSSVDAKNSVVHDGQVSMETQKSSKCISCQFLKDYGMSKKRCTKCDELNITQTYLASASNRVDSTFHSNVPKLEYTQSFVSSDCSRPKTDIRLLNHDYALDSKLLNSTIHASKSSMPSVSDGGNYLISSSGKSVSCTPVPVCGITNLVDSKDGILKASEVHVSASTSTKCTSVHQGNLKLSPLAKNATYTAENVHIASHSASSIVSVSKETSGTASTDVKNNIKVKPGVSNELVDHGEPCSKDKSKGYRREQKGSKTVVVNFVTPKEKADINDKVVGKMFGSRHVRCHSQSSIGSNTKSDADIDCDDDDDASNESSKEVNDNMDEVCKPGRKRKLSRSVSIPGWFGKGLNVKKRRRY
ncbi:NAD-dependent protein deacetylase sirtuin-7 [Mactra antiquata]